MPKIEAITARSLTHALSEKLIEEHGEFIAEKNANKKTEELADMVEVAIALAHQYGFTEDQFMRLVIEKRAKKGSFSKGYFYLGDENDLRALAAPKTPLIPANDSRVILAG